FAADHTRHCDAIILESVYHDIASAFAHRLRSSYPPWVGRLAGGIVWVTERRLGVRLAEVAPAEHVGRLAPAPVLLMTGTADAHAPPAEAQRLLARCRGPAELWLVPAAGHIDVFEQGGREYERRVLDFLDRSLQRARVARSASGGAHPPGVRPPVSGH
ncbi:MAG TPA: alpha/beta hydrolase, partial [Gemmataceae bacterium]|nr:alpha/beta hydrolase [Gemmataceae bacterium]